MPLNYQSFQVKDGAKDGVLEVHHEFVKIVVDDETTVLDLAHIVEVFVRARDPQDDDLWFRTSAGDWHKFKVEKPAPASAIVEAIPPSFQIGW